MDKRGLSASLRRDILQSWDGEFFGVDGSGIVQFTGEEEKSIDGESSAGQMPGRVQELIDFMLFQSVFDPGQGDVGDEFASFAFYVQGFQDTVDFFLQLDQFLALLKSEKEYLRPFWVGEKAAFLSLQLKRLKTYFR